MTVNFLLIVLPIWALSCGETNPANKQKSAVSSKQPPRRCAPARLSEDLPKGETEDSIARYYQKPLFGEKHHGEPDVSDVQQAGFNVCYFYAFLSSYVAHKPENVKKRIKQVESGFEIDVHDPGLEKPCLFITNRQLGIFRHSGRVHDTVLWPEVMAAAWVSYLGKTALNMADDMSVKATGTNRALGTELLREGKTIDMSLVMKDLFHYFLNQTGKVRRIKPRIGQPLNQNFVQNAHELLTFVTDCEKSDCIMYAYIAPGGEVPGPKTSGVMPSGLIDHHCYGVMGVDSVRQEISLRNPHGGSAASAVAYLTNGTMTRAFQLNEHFMLRSEDFYRQFYTLQFSEF